MKDLSQYPTPETDDLLLAHSKGPLPPLNDFAAISIHARDLERRLAAQREILQRIREFCKCATTRKLAAETLDATAPKP